MKTRMSKAGSRSKTRCERAIFTLPPKLLAEANDFANAFHEGNCNEFIAAAIRSYIGHLRKVRHTAKLRESYVAATVDARKVTREWEAASEEA